MSQSQSPHPLVNYLGAEIQEIISLWPQILLALKEVRDAEGAHLDYKVTLQWGGSLEQFQTPAIAFDDF